ncbi:MAG: anti-sigma factor [Verrucomicrobiales bacterium]
MNVDERWTRFEELDAGRVLGDLDAAEVAEWADLSRDFDGDAGLDQFAAELEAVMITEKPLALPPEISARLKREFSPAPVVKKPDNLVLGPWLGWAVAACLLGLLVVNGMISHKATSAAERRTVLLEKSGDAKRLSFTSASNSYNDAKGDVVWSDSKQEGYMTLSNIPANDPTKRQYQLWIVDPARDEIPVDGGVFDIPAGAGSVVIPINAKLAVRNPAAFVITLEQPGGVVKSKQEVVVALAKS